MRCSIIQKTKTALNLFPLFILVTDEIIDENDRVVSQREYAGTGTRSDTLKSSTDFTYASKTNYLTGVKHYSPLGTQNITYTYGNLANGQMPDQVYSVKWNGTEKVKYTYDAFGRLTGKKVGTFNNTYTYFNFATNRTTTLGMTVTTPAGKYSYTYDKADKVASYSDGTNKSTYGYDALSQLIRENNQKAGKTYVYSYVNGNITERKEYAYTTGTLGEVLATKSWSYGDTVWKDLLTNFNGEAITYDAIGNPTKIGAKTLKWNGRQLAEYANGENTIAYAYNGDGQRISKTVNGTKTEYYYNGSILAGQKTGSNTLVFMYDNNGDAFGFQYGGKEYFYVKNLQNDITAITDSAAKVIANYYYDAWGNITEITGDTTIANINPLRYRSYYYDTETELYYLNTRYYSPDMCRFINGDSYVDNRELVTQTMFQYCGNNPVNNADYSGKLFGGIILAGVIVVGVVLAFSGCSSKKSDIVSSTVPKPKPPVPETTVPPTTSYIPPQAVKSYAATVYAEAGGQNRRSKQAVAHVMNNRIGTRVSWKNIESVISAPYQFDGYNSSMYKKAMDYYNNGICDNPISKTAMDECLEVVIPIYNGEEADITGGATYFHSFKNPSDWTYHDSYTQVYVPGTENFWFYKE